MVCGRISSKGVRDSDFIDDTMDAQQYLDIIYQGNNTKIYLHTQELRNP